MCFNCLYVGCVLENKQTCAFIAFVLLLFLFKHSVMTLDVLCLMSWFPCPHVSFKFSCVFQCCSLSPSACPCLLLCASSPRYLTWAPPFSLLTCSSSCHYCLCLPCIPCRFIASICICSFVSSVWCSCSSDVPSISSYVSSLSVVCVFCLVPRMSPVSQWYVCFVFFILISFWGGCSSVGRAED